MKGKFLLIIYLQSQLSGFRGVKYFIVVFPYPGGSYFLPIFSQIVQCHIVIPYG